MSEDNEILYSAVNDQLISVYSFIRSIISYITPRSFTTSLATQVV